ncbi:MAG: chromosome partitioning protein, partial [Xanthobacteraceae bacterium]
AGGTAIAALFLALAASGAISGERCALDHCNDGDPQASAASWAAWRREAGREPSPVTTCLVGKAVFDEGKNLAKGFEHTVIDAGGRDSAGLRGALLLAERAIVPVGASNLDAAAMTDLLEIVELAKDFNAALDVRILLMRIDPRTKDTGEMIEYLHENKLQILDARICERVAYRRAIGEGATVAEIGKDPQAVAEMSALFKEIQQ